MTMLVTGQTPFILTVNDYLGDVLEKAVASLTYGQICVRYFNAGWFW